MADFDIPLLRSFVAVSRSGSISRAAGQVGRTQSAISMQMKRLEAVVGQPITRRSAGGVALTAAGERLLVHAERILGTHDAAVAHLSGAGLRGAISFGCPEDYLAAYFPDLLKRFSVLHAGIDIEIVCAPTVELRHLLQRRRIDLAVVSVPADTAGADILRREPFVWVASHPAPALLRISPLPLALSAVGTLDHAAAIGAVESAGIAHRIAFASNSLAGLIAVTRSGEAVSVVTRCAVPLDLHVLEDALPALPSVGVSLAYASVRPTPLVTAFGDFTASWLSRSDA